MGAIASTISAWMEGSRIFLQNDRRAIVMAIVGIMSISRMIYLFKS